MALAAGRSLAELGPLPPHTEVVDSKTALLHAEKALSKSGTSTLELALAGIPTVVAHRVHPLTWLVGRWLVRGVRHLALPNVLFERMEAIGTGPDSPIPEYLQHFSAADLSAALSRLSPPPSEKLRAFLTVPNDPRTVAERAADAILR